MKLVLKIRHGVFQKTEEAKTFHKIINSIHVLYRPSQAVI